MEYFLQFLSIVGTGVLGILGLAYGKPRDYLDLFHPMVGVARILMLGALFGTILTSTMAVRYVEPLLILVKGGPAVLSNIRRLWIWPAFMLLVILFTELAALLLARTMIARTSAP